MRKLKYLLISALIPVLLNQFVQKSYSKGRKVFSESHTSNLAHPERGNNEIENFSKSKKLLEKAYGRSGTTIYCKCQYSGKDVDLNSCGLKTVNNKKRSERLEWEHAVPAENFGRAFAEWRDGANCNGKKGRKCAGTNPIFKKIESDIYNLYPSEGEVNGLRSNYDYAPLRSSKYDFGKCGVKLDDKKFEPMDSAKGTLARSSLYMAWAYEGILRLSDQQRKLFEAWDRMFPPTQEECQIYYKKLEIQKNNNPFYEKCK
jgi:deoxyribonuclease-1